MATLRGFEFPDHLYYLIEHDTWARLDADGIVTIGITPLGARISGDFIEFMPKPVGTSVERERAFGMLEMSKVIRSVRTPVGGVVAAVNDRVRADPGLITTDPYGEGWLARVSPSDWPSDSSSLVTGAAIPAAVEAYMSALAESFGTSSP